VTLPLTPERLRAALYACAPVGESSLSAHLCAFGIDNSRKAVDEAMNALIVCGIRVSVKEAAGVRFLTIPGQERVA